MLNRNYSRVVVAFSALLAGFGSGFGLMAVASHLHGDRVVARAISQNPISHNSVTLPDGHPVPGQEAINTAMVMFNIVKPADAKAPVFDPDLKDRGLTVKSSWFGKTQVFIGPSAFTSWSMLGSTLAHEIEVHCRQNFPMIFMKDQMGLDGTAEAEREAYRYEIDNAHRFGLSSRDATLIAATVEYYYPRGK